jgi:hypothetical protein
MENRGESSMRRYWAQLTGSVHPEDEKVFAAHPKHTFNLDFPPPAYIGDIDKAPIVVLMSNGGYVPKIVATEFPDDTSISVYRNYIRGEILTLPPRLARYYATGHVGAWISAGKAVLVNAVPYRSRKLSQEPENQKVAELLPSLAAHRDWFAKEVLPAAVACRRFVLVHRNGWWRVPARFAGCCVLFSDPTHAEPNRQAPDQEKLDKADAWLARRGS